MPRSFPANLFLALLVFFLGGCSSLGIESKPKPLLASLRVGIYPAYPPMIFKQGDEIKGAEADFARRLAKTLGREAEFVELRWDELIPALTEKKIHIIMSGMTITEARKVRVNFTAPYLKIGQVALMRAEDSAQFNSLASIQESFATIGVVQGTTGETYVRAHFLKAAQIISFPAASDARYLLVNRKIDLFVHDGPSVAWLVSANEGVLKGFWEPFDEEYLGWAVNREDQDLLRKANSVLSNWQKDGTLKEVLGRWLPYRKDFN